VRERNKDGHDHFQYRIVAPEEVTGSFPPPQYLTNAGFVVPDPTAGSEAAGQLRSRWHLPTVLESPSYAVAEAIEQVEGSHCLVVQKGNAVAADSAAATAAERDSDKLWLDMDHGLAIQKRELRVDDQFVRVINGDFVEVIPGLWLPGRSRIEYFAPRGAPEKYQDRPILIRSMRLAGYVVNQVPADFFDIVLRQQRSATSSLLEVVKAYHILRKNDNDSVKEVWVADGLGRRMEVRKGSEVELLRIDTPAWTLVWRPKVNRATLLPSRLEALLLDDASLIGRREHTLRWSEELTAFFRIEKAAMGEL
jgi:hypothetical protein